MKIKKKIKLSIELFQEHGPHWHSLFLIRKIVSKVSSRLTDIVEKRMIRLERESGPRFDPDVLRPIAHTEFIRFEEKDRYYRDRWSYITRVINMVNEVAPRSVLEVGAHRFSVVKGAHSMDITNAMSNLVYRHDATQVPWPVKDKAYDLFMALQVWEHLSDKQPDAFGEVMRVSRAAILSFPYKWNKPGNCHHNIDEHVIEKWTLGAVPHRVEIVKNRIIYLFIFEDRSAPA